MGLLDDDIYQLTGVPGFNPGDSANSLPWGYSATSLNGGMQPMPQPMSLGDLQWQQAQMQGVAMQKMQALQNYLAQNEPDSNDTGIQADGGNEGNSQNFPGLLSDTPPDPQALSPYPVVPPILMSGNPGDSQDGPDAGQPQAMPQTVMPTALTGATRIDMPNRVATPTSQAAITPPAQLVASSGTGDFTPGQLLTYNAEGKTYKQTDHLHWPGGKSGVTLGKGYDMGMRTEAQVKADLMRAGVDEARATLLASGAGLKSSDAAGYVMAHSGDATISPAEQDRLFRLSYAQKEHEAKGVYTRAIRGVPGAVSWDDLNPSIRAVATDFTYQGTNHAQMRALSQNDSNTAIQYIQNHPELMQYEKGRNRINFLRNNP